MGFAEILVRIGVLICIPKEADPWPGDGRGGGGGTSGLGSEPLPYLLLEVRQTL